MKALVCVMVFNKQDGLNETRGLDRRAEWRGKEKSVREEDREGLD